MSYKLKFNNIALKEWKKLDKYIQEHFKSKLIERLKKPKVESSRLSGMKDCYKIKLKSVGYRLVYRVLDDEIIVLVLSVGKRERNQVYKNAIKRK